MWKAYVKWDLGWWCWLSMKGLLCWWSFRLSKVEFQVFIVTRGCCYIKTNMRERRNTCSCPGPSLMPVICICVCVCVASILQARILEWVAMPSSRGSSPPRDQTCFSCMAGRFVTTESAGKCFALALVTLCITHGGFCSVKRCAHCWMEETRMSGVNVLIESNAFNVHMTFTPAFLLLPINGTWGKKT